MFQLFAKLLGAQMNQHDREETDVLPMGRRKGCTQMLSENVRASCNLWHKIIAKNNIKMNLTGLHVLMNY